MIAVPKFVKYNGGSFTERRIEKTVLEERFGITVDEDLVWNAANSHQVKADDFSPELLQLLSEQRNMTVVDVGESKSSSSSASTDDAADDNAGQDSEDNDFVAFGSTVGSTDESR